jgi:hypothetical protein
MLPAPDPAFHTNRWQPFAPPAVDTACGGADQRAPRWRPSRFTNTLERLVTLEPARAGTQIDGAPVFDDAAMAEAPRSIVEPATEQNLDRLVDVLAGRPD